MIVLCLLSTKGGTGKTTTAANLGGIVADAGLRVLLIDADVQPTLSSYFHLRYRAASGLYELLTQDPQNINQFISHTAIDNLHLVLSNDHLGQLHSLLLHAPDGRLRLRNLLPSFHSRYDLVLIDTQGARSVLLEMAVLASSIALSPVTPEVLAARELHRGTAQLMRELAPYKHLGIDPPPLSLLVNRIHAVSATAKAVRTVLREVLQAELEIHVLRTEIPALEAYPRASMMGLPVHRIERRRPTGRFAPAALETMRQLAIELFPNWHTQLARVSGRFMAGCRDG